jgi:Legionella pneumophila major outer membrane protein precursor
MKRTVLSTLLFIGAQLSAFMDCGDFGGSIDYLYWKPAGMSLRRATVTRNLDDRSVRTSVVVDPTYDSGVRGEAWWRPECSRGALVGRFYWLSADHAQTFVGDSPTYRVRSEMDYYAGDVLAAYALCSSNCLSLELLAGAEVLYLANPFSSVQTETDTGDFTERLERHFRTSGGGATVGVAGSWRAWCALELFGEARCGLVFSSTRLASFREFPSSLSVDAPFSSQEWTREWNLRLGGRYLWCCGCAQVGVEAGWETRAYIDMAFAAVDSGSRALEDAGVAAVFAAGGTRGIAVGGPFIGITGRF